MPAFHPLPSHASRRGASRAFTLIELLVVILIIAILIAVAAPSFLGQQNKAKDSRAKQTLAIGYKAAKADAVGAGTAVAGRSQGEYVASTGDEGATATPPNANVPNAFGETELAAAILESEPQFGTVGVANAVNTSEVATEGQLYVVRDSGPDTLHLAVRSRDTTICELTVTKTTGPVYSGCSGSNTSGGSGGVTPGGAAFDSAVTADTPSAYYKFDEAAGSASAASTGSGPTLTRNGVPVFGGAGAMAGSTSVSLSSGNNLMSASSAVTSSGSYAVEAWVRPAVISQTNGTIAMSGSTGPSAGLVMMQCTYNSNSDPSTAGSCAGAIQPGDSWFSSSWAFPDTTTWHHLVLSSNGSTATLYVDGVQRGTWTKSTSTGNIGTRVGALNSAGNHAFTGAVNNLAFYDHPLTLARVEAHYTAGGGTL